LKPEWWGSPLVQEKYQEGKACDRRHTYRIIIIIRAKRISTHLEEQSLLPAEQKGCHPGSKGCKDQLMISKTIYEDCRRRNKN